MNEQTRATLGTVTVVAGLALIGYLAYLRVEAAAIAAPSIVIALVSWFTRPPERKDPPNAANAIPIIVASAILASLFACGCSAPPLTPKDCTKVGFREGDEACMRQYTAEGERIACRRANARACGVVFTPSPEAAK